MKGTCKNCQYPLNDRYCAHCGQKADTGRITFSFLLHELLHFFTHLEKGFLFTTKRMVLNPGEAITAFVAGSRKRYQPPVSYFLIWISVLFLTLYLLEMLFGENVAINYREYFGPGASTHFAIRHLALVLTVVIPFQALYLKILITGRRYYFAECLVVAVYVLGTIIFFQFVFALLALLIHLLTGNSVDIHYSDSFKMGYMLWFTTSFVRRFPVKHKVVRVLAFVILAFGTFTLWRYYGFPALIQRFPLLEH